METIALWITHYGYFAIFFLLVLGIVGLPVPDEWLLTFAGYLAYKGNLNLWSAFAAAFLGSMCGITVSYGLGRSLGHYVLHHYSRFFRVTQEDLNKVHVWFDRFGTWMLLVGYFIPGVRHLTALVAGTSDLQYLHFSIFAYSGALIWVTTFIGLGYCLGERWSHVLGQIEKHSEIFGCIAIVVVSVFLIHWFRKRRAEGGTRLKL